MARPSKSTENEKTLKARFRNRLTSMKKQAKELSILCDVPVGIICYRESDGKFETWPENLTEFNGVITKYRNTDKKKKKEPNVGVDKMDELRGLNERKRWIDSEVEAVKERIRVLKEQRSSTLQIENDKDDDYFREMGISDLLLPNFR